MQNLRSPDFTLLQSALQVLKAGETCEYDGVSHSVTKKNTVAIMARFISNLPIYLMVNLIAALLVLGSADVLFGAIPD